MRRYEAAAEALRAGDWRKAQQLATGLIPEMQATASVYFIAGAAGLELGQTTAAIGYLVRAVELDLARADYCAQLSRALASAHRGPEALAAADRAWALEPRDPMTLDTLGVVYSRLRQHERAAQVFQRLVEIQPHAGYHFNLATSLVFTGNVAAAEAELEKCLEQDPGFWAAYPALAQLRRQTVGNNHVKRLLAVLREARSADAATYVHMALAKELEDLEQYPRAFEHLVAGKAARRATRPYSISRDAALFEAIQQNSGTEPMAPVAPGLGSEAVFIFGMPRSGTTLVERILSSHRDVRSAGEPEDFAIAVKRASGSTTSLLLDPDTIARSRRLDWGRVGAGYIAGMNAGGADKRTFIDKLPQNFLYAWHIANALPNAKMICVRRNPMDTCLGNFRQLFARASSYYDYSLDLLDTGRYYILFDRLMTHWEKLMPGRILTVRYEMLVNEQEACTRQILRHCGLRWDEACLRFETNAAPVATASALQVRKPMNRDSVNRWKLYESQLMQLRKLLTEAGMAITD